jgi:subtilisin family serine protease
MLNCHRLARALLAILLLAPAPALVSAAPIRLRNQLIEPPPTAPAAALNTKTAEAPQAGLFLIQLNNAPTTVQREQLAAMGIELLRYVPEDAFIARFHNASTRKAYALGNVTFITPYKPEHKLDQRLLANLKPKGGNLQPVPVRILLAPRADAKESLEARRLLGRIHQENRLRLTPVLRADILPSRLEALSRSPAVLWIEPDRPMRLNDEVSSKIVAGDAAPHQTVMQSLGFDGSGVTVAVADSGLNYGAAETMHPDLFGRTPAFFFYGDLTNAADEHSHGTHVAGIIAGNGAVGEADENEALWGLGVAPGASIIAQRMFDGDGGYQPPSSFEKLTRDATQAGAVIGSNSWGDDTQGRYDISAAEFDELVRDSDATLAGDQPYILEFSAGNAGPAAQTVGSPAVAKNVIATGACQNDRFDLFLYDTGQDTMADFSSRGPCEDGRIKPDLVAPGTWIASLKSAAATDENAWASISANYLYQGGTSQAGPHASGAAAVFVQYYRATHTNATPSPALAKAALINSATAMDPEVEVGPAPNYDEGWGRVDLPELIGSSKSYEFVDQSVLLTNNAVWEKRVVIGSVNEPLKITLTYTDVPGLPATIPALVNDLDLEVVSPEGFLFRGNQFSAGESIPQASATDVVNNVEGVHLEFPTPGEYLIRVRARKVVEDSRRETPAIDQDFALVISGDLPLPGKGVVVLDRHSYTAPSQIKIRLIDRDLAGFANTTVTVRSTIESSGELVILSASGTTGSFTGAVATATGPATSDGKLQITHGNIIEAVYFDSSGATNQIATAVADLVPPLLTNISVTNEFGQMILSWTSDEPATSIVRYSTNTSLALAATNGMLTTEHVLVLSGLAANQTNRFAVISADEAGNIGTNNNGGNLFTFVTVSAASVLVLDAGEDFLLGIPPISGYTEPLDQLGVDFSVWATDQRGVPDLSPAGTGWQSHLTTVDQPLQQPEQLRGPRRLALHRQHGRPEPSGRSRGSSV